MNDYFSRGPGMTLFWSQQLFIFLRQAIILHIPEHGKVVRKMNTRLIRTDAHTLIELLLLLASLSRKMRLDTNDTAATYSHRNYYLLYPGICCWARSIEDICTLQGRRLGRSLETGSELCSAESSSASGHFIKLLLFDA